jgi:hypothetical protein
VGNNNIEISSALGDGFFVLLTLCDPYPRAVG